MHSHHYNQPRQRFLLIQGRSHFQVECFRFDSSTKLCPFGMKVKGLPIVLTRKSVQGKILATKSSCEWPFFHTSSWRSVHMSFFLIFQVTTLVQSRLSISLPVPQFQFDLLVNINPSRWGFVRPDSHGCRPKGTLSTTRGPSSLFIALIIGHFRWGLTKTFRDRLVCWPSFFEVTRTT